MNLLEGLNDAQHLAVTTEGSVMVMAGAGSGKTKVLTTRISYIIEELGIAPSAILAVTFTNKAANEMKERIAKSLNINTTYMWISTFHAFCARLLRIEIENLPGYKKNFSIADEEDSLKIVKETLKIVGMDYKAKEIRKLISKYKNFSSISINNPNLSNDFHYILRKYNELLKRNNLLDFDDLIIKVIELFKVCPLVLEKYQNKFQYVLVDEFQDTNSLQYELILMLALKHHSLFVVGDDFQSIYSFRGAKIENINRLRKDFKETKLILLEKNYRSTTEILNLANCVIEHNPNQIKKVMYSNDKFGSKPILYQAVSSYDEVLYVIDKIKYGLVDGKKYSDFAILYRANYISRAFEDELIRQQIPYKIFGGISFFARKEIKDMVAYLRLIIDFNDDFSFKRIVNEPKRKIGNAILSRLTDIALENGKSLFNSIELYNGKGIGATNLLEFQKIIASISAQIESIPLNRIIKLILEEVGYADELKKDMDTYQDRIENIYELSVFLDESQKLYEGLSNKDILEKILLDLSLRTDNDDADDGNRVILSTYHQVKGLEFDTVFMVAMEEGVFPSLNSVTEFEIEEERRICYVGITRAKNNLYITHSEQRMLFGDCDYQDPSRFIREMDKSLYINYKKPVAKPVQVIPKKPVVKSITSQGKPDELKTGDKVNHKVFGNGIVVSINGRIANIAFPSPHGVKSLAKDHPSIKKI